MPDFTCLFFPYFDAAWLVTPLDTYNSAAAAEGYQLMFFLDAAI